MKTKNETAGRGTSLLVRAAIAIGLGIGLTSVANAETQEVMLASIDAGRVVAPNSPQANRTRDAIKKMMAVCPKEKADFPDRVASVTKSELTEKGQLTYATEVFEGIRAIVIDYVGTDCTKVFARYVGARASTGMNHSEAVASIRAVMVAVSSASQK